MQEESRKRQVNELDQQLQSYQTRLQTSHCELQSCQSERQREVSELNRQLQSSQHQNTGLEQQLQQLVNFPHQNV